MSYEQEQKLEKALKELGRVIADALYLEPICMWLYRIFTIRIWE